MKFQYIIKHIPTDKIISKGLRVTNPSEEDAQSALDEINECINNRGHAILNMEQYNGNIHYIPRDMLRECLIILKKTEELDCDRCLW